MIPTGSVFPVSLTCEYSRNPLGIESQNPKLSWKLVSDHKNQVQKAYQVLVASSNELLAEDKGDVWNSGKVSSGQSVHIHYKGSELVSGHRYYWKVRVWDKKLRTSDWSEPAFWEMGMLDPADWKADWIAYHSQGAPLFRKTFNISGKVRKASIYICGLGYFELRMNGQKIGEHVLDPGQTDYEKRSFYVVHDVSDRIKAGENVLGVELGNGFYHQTEVSGAFGWDKPDYGEPRFIAQLFVRFEDGSDTLIISDQNWKATDGPTYFNNVYVGDYYDARLEQTGWDMAGFDDTRWDQARLIVGPGGKLVSQKLPPIKKMKKVVPIEIFQPRPGVYVYDMGQNFAGWARLKINAASGTEIQLRFSEEIFDDHMINMASCGGYATRVEQTDRYICKGGGKAETWEPKFTYHGFRYVEMTGFPGQPGLDNLEGIVVYTSSAKAGDFICSDTLINKIHKAAIWTATSNIHSIITDCPHREKCGWLGDIIAEMLIYNLDVPLLLSKFERDIETSRNGVKPVVANDALPGNLDKGIDYAGIPWDIAPGRRTGGHRPDWGSTFIHLPWYMYQYYGDLSLCREHWEGMTDFMAHLAGLSEEKIIYQGYGDMFSPGHIWSVETPVALTSTAIYYVNAEIMASMAAALEKSLESSFYDNLASEIRASFINEFYDPEVKTYGSQTANAIALEFGLVPDGDEQDVANSMALDIMEKHDGHFNTGHMGSRYLYPSLAEYHHGSVAMEILQQTSYPGIGHLFSRGATTFWESWGEKEIDENSAGVRSRNHPFQAGYDAWFFSGIGGIKPDPALPGFKRIQLAPQLTGEVSFARVNYESIYGTIKSDWRIKDGDLYWSVSVPVNTTAMVHFPTEKVEAIFESTHGISETEGAAFVGIIDEKAVYSIGSGEYSFVIRNHIHD